MLGDDQLTESLHPTATQTRQMANATMCIHSNLKGQYRHDQSRLSTGHGIGVLV